MFREMNPVYPGESSFPWGIIAWHDSDEKWASDKTKATAERQEDGFYDHPMGIEPGTSNAKSLGCYSLG